MFGIKRFDNLVLEAGKTFELGALNLLRAYAKTEIIDKPSASEKHSIKKVELLRYCASEVPLGTSGYVPQLARNITLTDFLLSRL